MQMLDVVSNSFLVIAAHFFAEAQLVAGEQVAVEWMKVDLTNWKEVVAS